MIAIFEFRVIVGATDVIERISAETWGDAGQQVRSRYGVEATIRPLCRIGAPEIPLVRFA